MGRGLAQSSGDPGDSDSGVQVSDGALVKPCPGRNCCRRVRLKGLKLTVSLGDLISTRGLMVPGWPCLPQASVGLAHSNAV